MILPLDDTPYLNAFSSLRCLKHASKLPFDFLKRRAETWIVRPARLDDFSEIRKPLLRKKLRGKIWTI